MTKVYDEDGIVLYHGDFRKGLEQLGGTKFDLCMADCPYGVTSLAWDRWIKGWPRDIYAHLVESGSMWCFGSMSMFLSRWPEFDDWRMSQEIVWEKHNGSNFHADKFKRVHELAVHLYPIRHKWEDIYKSPVYTADATKRTVRRKKRPAHTGNIDAGAYESHDGGPRLMRSVMYHRSCHGFAKNECQKPVDLLQPLIEYACPPGGTILVPFVGSGSDLVAARKLGRRAVGFEVREEQCLAAIDRLRQGELFTCQQSIPQPARCPSPSQPTRKATVT